MDKEADPNRECDEGATQGNSWRLEFACGVESHSLRHITKQVVDNADITLQINHLMNLHPTHSAPLAHSIGPNSLFFITTRELYYHRLSLRRWPGYPSLGIPLQLGQGRANALPVRHSYPVVAADQGGQ